ncbi:TonB-dependent receptor [Lysobacter gummosus]|uniref:TonB-dependent siderophore receptor n=1 Tax=Lysobacter gummosus TaxID=262324 RepID=A0ABY3X8P0_9GAMM|nr:TonB-dependent siderophore receptor [Lysobacter gummosus]ALN93468.1 tonB-dependent siderophore receptor family protein [Lysobacter gummosus]UNP28924.1 TonB-dependent siderophore receptor [Lysobacter gummosus]
MHKRNLRTFRPAALACSLLACAAPAAHAGEAVDLDAVRVHGQRVDARAASVATASRLGLDPAEIPATLDVLDRDDIQARGLRDSVEVLRAMPGVMAGNLPGQPGVASMRGFASGAVSYLFDGVRLTSSGFSSRNWDSFQFERVEVLKGPASVLYGEGVLAGAINFVPKSASLDGRDGELLLAYGSHDSARLGLDANVPLSPTVAVRGVLSANRSDGYIDDTASDAQSFGGSLLWQPDDDLSARVALDYQRDDFDTAYFGAPLLPRESAADPSGLVDNAAGWVIDKAARSRNYNVRDGRMDSRSWWLRTRLDYRLSEDWNLSQEASVYDARRRWDNTEDFRYDTATGLFDRDSARIHHDQRVWNERLTLKHDGRLAGRRHSFAAGMEYSDTDFFNLRRFGHAAPVDLLALDRGEFPTDTAANFDNGRSDFGTRVKVAALFVEDALNLTPRWLLVGGLRHERIDLQRRNLDLDSGARSRFNREFSPTSWRLGSVFELRPGSQLYAQYSSAVLPVSSFLTINQRNNAFDLSHGDAVELGLRSALFDQRLRLNAAVYRLRQDDIVTRDPLQPQISVQNGRQSSRGVELSLSAQATARLRIDASAALLSARFDTLREAGGADRSGNRPSNVPERTASLDAWYRLDGLPLSFNLGLRHVGDFYTDNANSTRVRAHTVADAAVDWNGAGGRYTVRVRNLTDAFYADWSGYSPSQVYLGAPRSVELSYSRSF